MRSRKGSNLVMRYSSLLCITMLVVLSMTGCGSKLTYVDIVSEMNSQKTGTFTYDIVLSKQSQEGLVSTTTAIVERGITDTTEYMNMQVTLSDKDSVTLNSVVVDGVRYLNLQDLRSSLQNCTDADLLFYGNSIPINIGYVSCEDADIKFKSLFAETAELEESGFVGVSNLDSRLDLIVDMFLGICKDNSALSHDSKNKVYTVASTDKFSTVVNDFICKPGTYYDKYITNLQTKELASEYELSQGFAYQKDNFVTSLAGIWKNGEIVEPLEASCSGTIDKYEGDNTGVEYRGDFTLGWFNSTNSYTLTVKFGTKQSASEVSKPDGTNVDLDTFVRDYVDITKLNKLLLCKFNVTPWSISDTRLDYEDDVFKASVEKDMQKYLGIDTSVSDYLQSEGTKADAMLSVLDELTGGFKVIVSEEVQTEQSKYQPLSGYLENGLEYKASVDEARTTSSILVVNARLLNPTDEAVTIKTTKFSLKDSGTTKISANIEARLLEIQPEFDKTLYSEKLMLEPSTFVDTSLYFVIPEESGHFDLYFDKAVLGNIVVY